MKLQQMEELLQLYSQLIEPSQRDVALKIAVLAGRLGAAHSSTLKKISQPNLSEYRGSAADIDSGVNDALLGLEALLRSAGAKICKDVSELTRIISENFNGSSDAFAEALSRPAPTASKKDQPVRLDIVRAYADELATFENDNNAFDQLIARVKSDRNVRKQEMHELANRFLGYRVKSSTKEKLLDKIVDMQAKNARQEARTKTQ